LAAFPRQFVIKPKYRQKYRQNFIDIHPHTPYLFFEKIALRLPLPHSLSRGSTTMIFQLAERRIVGPAGELLIPDGDVITPRLLMLIEGQCEGLGPMLAAQKYGLSSDIIRCKNNFKKMG
jgi:hypothetical protein